MSEERTTPARGFNWPRAIGNLRLLGLAALLAGLFPAPPGLAGTVSAPYQIGTWQGFRQAAVTYTFDDNQPNQYAIAVPMFNAKGFKLTLFTITGYLADADWVRLQTAAAYGHEVASHTVTHSDLSAESADQVVSELRDSQSAINTHIPGEPCLTLAYPYCVPPLEPSLVYTYYIGARVCDNRLAPATPADFLRISAIECGTDGWLQFQDIIAQAEAAAVAGAWCVYELHALDNDPGWSPLPSATLEATLNYLSTNQSRFWVETFAHVACYIRERDAASVTETVNSADRLTLQVTHDLAPWIYNYPLTLRRPLPPDWPAAAAVQNHQPLAVQRVALGSTNYVMFDVVPNGGDVTLSKLVVPVVLSRPALTPGNHFSFRLQGQAGARYAIESSSDHVHWTALQTNLLVGWCTNWSVWAPVNQQFYRARWVP